MYQYTAEENELNSSQLSTETVISIPLDIENPSSTGSVSENENIYSPFTHHTDITSAYPESTPSPSENFQPVPVYDDIEITTQQSDSSQSSLSDYELTFADNSDEDDNDPIHPVLTLSNTTRDRVNPEDEGIWIKLDPDDIWSVPPLPLLVTGGVLNMLSNDREPETFFEALFDNHMWTHLAENTNLYASKRKGNCPIQAMDNPNYKKFSRLNDWKEVTESELQIFVAHLLVMGVLRKPDLESYWCSTGVCQTPFFGRFMSRNRFTAILANLHVTDDSTNPPFTSPGHDPLAKLRPFITMCEDNFKFTYKPYRDLSMDESCCPWKGRLRFRLYNPRKPARFHIKLFQICEATSGYIAGFSIYTGKNSCVDESVCADTECSTTTKVVMTLANKCQLLDKGHRIFFDNYYSSPELLEELLHRNTSSCGTVRSNRKGLPIAVTKANLKPGETCFRRSVGRDGHPGSILALKWCDKRSVYMISTSHAATEKWTGKNHRVHGTPIYKPSVIVDYIERMGGVDLSDQLMTYYSFLRKSCKWWRKLFVHILNMLILNAYILNKKFGTRKMNHSEYREHLAAYLIKKATGSFLHPQNLEMSTSLDQHLYDEHTFRLNGRHFPQKLSRVCNARIKPITCKVCFVGKSESAKTGKIKRRRSTSFKCTQCNKAMCIEPCFRIYHVYQDYKKYL